MNMALESTPIPILMFHRIGEPNVSSSVSGHYVSPRLFEKQLRLLTKLDFRTVPLASLSDPGAALPRKPLVITFDDGYAGFHTHALPALELHGFQPTVFLVADLIGGTNDWDVAKGDVREPLLSATQIADSLARGVDFGSHTLSHEDLSACPLDEARRQVERSKASLELLIDRPIASFCYPYGRSTPEVRSLVQEAGYALACGTGKGVFRPGVDRYDLPRINVRRDTPPAVLLYKLWRGATLGR